MSTEATTEQAPSSNNQSSEKKWPGWPGDCVFRLIVPVLKVGSIIGRKGELIKKICEDTKARIRVLDGPVSNPDRIVLISGKEETEAPLSPAMDAVIKVFKRVNGFPDDEAAGLASVPFCSIRL
ncbi:RNA-binding KH domain-containing protein PEPPER-like protein, partial [Tanacetum coccineum]